MTETKEKFAPPGDPNSRIGVLRRLPLNALRIFESAGRLGSFAAAAEELDLSPSAVSHAIRKLEQAVDYPLFVRTTRAISLTREGTLLLEHIQRGMDEMTLGLQRAALKSAPLRLHSAPAFATQWLMPRLSNFLALHPGINLQVSADTKYARFDNDDYDIDIVYGDPAHSSHEKIPLLIEELTPMCSPALASSIRTIQDLYSLALIQSTGQTVQWRGWFGANDLMAPTSFPLAFDRSSMSIAAAVDGLGVAMESTLLAHKELSTGALVAPLRNHSNPVRYVGHHLVYPRRHVQHAAFMQFKSWLVEELSRSHSSLDPCAV